ncbi:MAG: sulfatase-like hydrolase/transferase [Fuerstiella sp.]|nr:sulfatase-like hydrolase/transferase [Fuerstiella sp.]
MQRTMIIPVLTAGLVLYCCYDNAEADSARPNFIVINIDDLGYGDIGPFGNTVNRTPNLDRLAMEGCRLTCFYAAPVCSPSRASLMTGCYPKRVLSIPNVLFPGEDTGLDAGEITIAELLKDRGYATGIIGKWHLGDQPEFLPTRQGFDYFYGLPYSNDMGPAADGARSNAGQSLPSTERSSHGTHPPLPLLRNETVLQRVLPDDQHVIVERYTQEAVSFLWNHRDEPFFLYLPHSAVHFPLYPGKQFQGKSQHGLFGDWVEEVDWSVGQILQTIGQLGLSDNTLIIFTSDNGGQQRHGAVNAPLRGGKGTTFEGGMRVPTIAWWPGHIPPGTVVGQVAGMMDILPTFVSLAGGHLPDDRKIDGRNIWPLLAGHENVQSPHETFFYYRGLRLEALRQGPWKLHLKHGELYNLEDDIAESTNVALKYTSVVAQLRSIAEATDSDLGQDGPGPGCRPLGRVQTAQPLIAHDGTVREGFENPKIHAGQGIMVGELTPSSAFVQVRLTQSDHLLDRDLPGIAGVVEFSLCSADGGDVVTRTTNAADEQDFIARTWFEGLLPGAEYVCKTRIGTVKEDLRVGPMASFRTLYGAGRSQPVKFVVVTGMNHREFHGDDPSGLGRPLLVSPGLPVEYAGPDRHIGYPSLDTIRRLNPFFFVGTGDNIYYDFPSGKLRAQSLTEMRQKWHEQFVQDRYQQLFAVVPTYWMIDDHDYRLDDCDNSGDYDPSPELGRRVMLEQLPYGPASDDSLKTYRTHRVSKDLQVWFPENRLHRSPNRTADGPDKTIWGVEQKSWLKKTLSESRATFKLLVSPTPMIGPDDKRKTDNHTNFGGFRHERDEFFEWLSETGVAKDFFLVCGDRHWQYHSVHPTGIEEFSCGALVDANSRLGRQPGDPESTDPNGLIRQPYTQTVASGGFLEIECLPASAGERTSLYFRFRDERGVLLYEHVKLQSAP